VGFKYDFRESFNKSQDKVSKEIDVELEKIREQVEQGLIQTEELESIFSGFSQRHIVHSVVELLENYHQKLMEYLDEKNES
jgi:hypothetical protein